MEAEQKALWRAFGDLDEAFKEYGWALHIRSLPKKDEYDLKAGLKCVAPEVLDRYHALEKEFLNRGWKLEFPNTSVPIEELLPPPPPGYESISDLELMEKWTNLRAEMVIRKMIPPPKAELVQDFDPNPIYDEFLELKERFKEQGFTLPEPLCDMPPPL